MEIHSFLNKTEVDEKLANDLIKKIKNDFSNEEDVIIAVSGGSTPFDMYRILSKNLITLMNENKIPNIIIIQVDERYVASTSKRSNQKQLRNLFTEPIEFYPMNPSDVVTKFKDSIITTNLEYTTILESRGKDAPDIIILGMGSDGHTASLFPSNKEYVRSIMENGLDTVSDDKIVLGMFVESQNENRITMTSQLINKSSCKILFATGEEKLRTLFDALKADNKVDYPILSVINDIKLYTINHPLLEKIKSL